MLFFSTVCRLNHLWFLLMISPFNWYVSSNGKPNFTLLLILFLCLSLYTQVRLQSEYLAMDDALYYLDRALASHSNTTIDINSFLKETRRLARQQFLCKSHIRKIQVRKSQRQRQTETIYILFHSADISHCLGSNWSKLSLIMTGVIMSDGDG